MTASEIIQIVLAVVSLLVTIVLTVGIFWVQQRHEKMIEKENERRHKESVAEAAKVFIINNQEEIDYLPLCVIASSVNQYKKHMRLIYTRFNKCTEEVQLEILRQENLPLKLIESKDWTQRYIERFVSDAEKYNFGKTQLYDVAKCFLTGFDHYGKMAIKDINSHTFESSDDGGAVISQANPTADLALYIDRYLSVILNDKDSIEDTDSSQIPPFDLILKFCQGKDESAFCLWVMRLVKSACMAFAGHGLTKNTSDFCKISTSGLKTERYEDIYYDALLQLYQTYAE